MTLCIDEIWISLAYIFLSLVLEIVLWKKIEQTECLNTLKFHYLFIPSSCVFVEILYI